MDTPLGDDAVAHLQSHLTDQERARASAMAMPAQRQRFLTRRGLLRLILSRYLQTSPDQVQLAYGPQGKPLLCGQRHAGVPLHFNFTHSRDLALLAITRENEIGVDVEAIDTQRSIQGIARRYFHPREWQCIAAMPADIQPRAFFDNWACKEAIVKAHGGGIMAGLGTFVIQGIAPQPGPRQVLDTQGRLLPWTLRTLEVTDKTDHPFVAAVAMRGSQWACSTTLADAADLL